MGICRGMFPIFFHDSSIIISMPCFQVHIQNTFILVIVLRSYLIYEIVYTGTVELCVYGCVDVGLDH